MDNNQEENIRLAQQDLRESNKREREEHERANISYTPQFSKYIDDLRTELTEAKAVIQKLNEAILVIEIILNRE